MRESEISQPVWKRRIQNIALVLAGFVFSFAMLEFGLRFAGFSFPLYPETIEFGFPNPRQIQSHYRADPDFLWIQKKYEEKLTAAQGTDIAFMGCSCTEFGQYDLFFAELVSDRHPGRGVSTVNLGVGGWSTYQGLRQLERDVVRLKPKIVTIDYGWNDHWIGFGLADEDIARLNRSLLYRLRNLRLVQFLQRARLLLSRADRQEFPRRVPPEDFEKNLTRMIEVAQSHEITPILCTAPSSHTPGREPAHLANRWLQRLEELVPLHRRYAAIVRKVAKENDVLLCDLAERFDRLPREEVVRDYFRADGIHFTEQGDRKLAEMLVEFFEEHDLLETVLKPSDEARQVPSGYPQDDGALPTKGEADPSLPSRVGIDRAIIHNTQLLVVEGWALSPKPIDYVLVVVEDRNMGVAGYPVEKVRVKPIVER